MKLTNKFDLPQPIYDAVKNDPYSKGDADYSITGLVKPARISALEKKYWDDLEEDCADRIFSLFGQIGHGILERAERVATAEKRLFMDVDGKRISGAMDRILIERDLLQDYKFVTVWKLKDGVSWEFEAQLNCYILLCKANGITISRAQIVGLLRDWYRPTARRDPNYPQKQILVLDVPIWDTTKTIEFIKARIKAHEDAKAILPECSKEDRWASDPSWAVKKPGGKRAVRVYYTETEALEHAAVFKAENYTIEFRPGENKRCNDYCIVAPFCDQYKQSVPK